MGVVFVLMSTFGYSHVRCPPESCWKPKVYEVSCFSDLILYAYVHIFKENNRPFYDRLNLDLQRSKPIIIGCFDFGHVYHSSADTCAVHSNIPTKSHNGKSASLTKGKFRG